MTYQDRSGQAWSQEFTHAYVDGELAADERDRALGLLDGDNDFKAQVCETRVLKDLVRGAYADVPVAGGGNAARQCASGWSRALAAGLLLAVGLGGGWLARGELGGVMGGAMGGAQPAPPLAGLPAHIQPITLASAVRGDRIVLHLDSSERARMASALDLAERFVVERGATARVEVVVNSYGLDLLRQDTSPLRARIERLAGHHGNLAFIACGQTIARLRREGVHVELLPQANVATSAIGEILGRMREGWMYVKV